jgi:hypothetical protein
MAVNYDTSGNGLLPSGVLQPYGQNILKYGIGQLGTPIDVGALTPQVAGQTAFQQQAQQGIANQSGLGDIQRDASGMVTGFTGGTGVASYQPYLNQMSQFNTAAEGLSDPSQDYQAFMSPYQQEVINTTMADFDRQAQIGSGQVGMNAYTAGAFGGSRQGVAEAEYQSSSDRNRAALLAGLYGQGYDQAQGYRQQAMTNQLGPGMEQQNLASLSAVGQQDQLLEQSKLNAMAQANQSAYQLPLDRITDVANIYGTVSGAMPGSPTQKFAPNPLLTGIGGFANMYTTLGGSAMTRGAPQQSYADIVRSSTGQGVSVGDM